MQSIKKITIVVIFLSVLILVGIFAFYQYFIMKTKVQYDKESAKTEIPTEQKNLSDPTSQNDNIDIKTQDIEAKGTNGGGTLTICLDKCDDGICQGVDPSCENDSINCVCFENKTECPQDCK